MFFTATCDVTVCVICSQKMNVVTENNLRRHYKNKHESLYSEDFITEHEKFDKFLELERKLLNQTTTSSSDDNEKNIKKT